MGPPIASLSASPAHRRRAHCERVAQAMQGAMVDCIDRRTSLARSVHRRLFSGVFWLCGNSAMGPAGTATRSATLADLTEQCITRGCELMGGMAGSVVGTLCHASDRAAGARHGGARGAHLGALVGHLLNVVWRGALSLIPMVVALVAGKYLNMLALLLGTFGAIEGTFASLGVCLGMAFEAPGPFAADPSFSVAG